MAPRRPPVVNPEDIRDDFATRPRRRHGSTVGQGRTSRASKAAEAPTEAPRMWVPPTRTWPTFDAVHERVAPYSMDTVRDCE